MQKLHDQKKFTNLENNFGTLQSKINILNFYNKKELCSQGLKSSQIKKLDIFYEIFYLCVVGISMFYIQFKIIFIKFNEKLKTVKAKISFLT